MEKSARSLWIDYLRSFLTVLVVAHHSALAYTTFAYFDTTTYINSTSPVVDGSRWIGMDLLVGYNDIFFMSLMFLVSGLFVFRGMERKGRRKYLADRCRRLGIPFLVAVTLVIPIAYLPSFYLVEHHFNLSLFVRDYIYHQQWPVGPPWFIWLLLLFNIIAVVIPSRFYRWAGNGIAGLTRRPILFLVVAFFCVSLAFIPLSLWIGQYKWTGFGPFDFQVNRLPLYFLFFIFGACLGTADWERHFFKDNRLFNIAWPYWLVMALVCFIGVQLFTFYGFEPVRAGRMSLVAAYFIFDLLFVASCIASSLAFLVFFRQKVKKPLNRWDGLSSNAFGIYLVHYVFVTWTQFLLMNVSWPAGMKFSVVFCFSLAASWGLVNAVRKIRGVRGII